MDIEKTIAKNEVDKKVEDLNTAKTETRFDSEKITLAEQATTRTNEINKKVGEIETTTPSEVSQIENLGGEIGDKTAEVDKKIETVKSETIKEIEAVKEGISEEVIFGDEKVPCRRVDMLKEYAEAFKTADSYRKVGTVEARQAKEREEIATSQDGMKNFAEPGDWIIQNPGDKDPYVFGSKEDPIEVRQAKFAKKYDVIEGEEGKFRPKGIIKAIKVNENIVFDTSWGEKMAVKAGGWVADGGYAIAEDSFNNTYEKIEEKK